MNTTLIARLWTKILLFLFHLTWCRSLALWLARFLGSIYYFLKSIGVLLVFCLAVVVFGFWIAYSVLHPKEVSFQLPLITLASCALLWLIFWAWQAHKRLVVEDVVDYTDAQPGAGVKGLATLVVTRLGQLHDLYRTVDEQRAIRTSVSQNESIDANIEVEDVSEFLKDAVSIQSTLHLGPLEIPAGALLSLFGRIVQGPRIIGSLHKDKTLLILIAQIVGWKYPFKWQVVIPLSSVELADSHSYNLVEMVDELASRMFTDLTLDGSVRWKAMAAFSKGLQAYRECLRTPKNRRVNLKEAEKKFIETLAEDVEFGLAYYNLGVVYTELGRTEAAEIAFEKAITQNPDSWYSYYALALSRCEYRRYYRAIQLCKRVIELKPDRASIAKAYQLMGSAQRRLPGQSLEEQEKGVAQGQSDRQIPAKESTIKSISHSWIALCSAELRGQGKGTTERSKISQLETLASICLADLATFYIEDADPKEVGQVRTISKDETRSACLRAERQLKQALSLKRVDATYSALYHYNLGKAYYLLQRYADATHELRIATRIIPDNVTYWAELALAYAYTVTCEDIVQSKNVANAVFLKYGNKTSRPLELTYAVLCSGFVTSGFKERSTKEIRDLNYEKYVIETIIDFVSEAPAEDFKKALVKTREAYKKLDECDKLHKKLIEEGESRRTKIVELIEAFLDLPYFLDLLYNVEQSKKRDEIEKKLEDFKRDSKKAEHVQVFRTLGQLYLEFEKKRDAEKLIEGLKQQLVKFHGKKLESAQISLALGRLYLKYDKKQEFKKLVKKLLRELEQIPCEGKELEYAQIALMLEKLCLEFDKKPASSRLNLACNKKWDFKKLLERLKQQLEHFEGEGKEWEHGQLLRILAELCFDTEQFEQAEAFYKQAIEVLEEKYPRETRLQRLRSLLASTFAKRGKSYEALQIVQEAISLEALGCDNHKMLGDLYFAQEEFERAIDAWKEALSRRDLIIRSLNDPEIDLKIGRTYAKLVQQHREPDQRKIEYQHALSHFKQALDLYESDQQQQRLAVYFSLGYFHFALGEYEDAIKYLRVSQKFGLARLTSTFYLAYAYLRRREYDECIEQFQGLQRGAEEELRKQPGSQLKTIVEGESIEPISLGEMLALAYWGQAFAYAERNTNLQKALCLIIAAQKQIEDTFGKKNISEAQFSARYPDCKGWLLYKQGKIDDAIRSLEQAVTLTAHTEIYLHLALAYESKLRKTTNKTQKEILATRVRTSCQHIQELDIDGQYEQQVNDLLQRLQEKG